MGTIPAWWTDPYPEVRSTQTATDYLDGLGAALRRSDTDDGWTLSTGEQELITVGTEREVDAFVLGFALAHVICERHGPIGQRSGPTRLPHPAENEGSAALAADSDVTDSLDEGSTDAESDSDDEAAGNAGDAVDIADTGDGGAGESDAGEGEAEADVGREGDEDQAD